MGIYIGGRNMGISHFKRDRVAASNRFCKKPSLGRLKQQNMWLSCLCKLTHSPSKLGIFDKLWSTTPDKCRANQARCNATFGTGKLVMILMARKNVILKRAQATKQNRMFVIP